MKVAGKIREWLPIYKTNLNLALPVMLSQAGQVFVQLVDNAMVGRLGAVPLAAISFGSAIFMVFMLTGMGLSLGLTPLVGEVYARRGHRNASYFFQNSITLYAIAGIGLFLMLYFVGIFLGNFGQDPKVVAIARPYYNYLAWSIIPFMIFAAFKQFLEGIGNTLTAMVIIIAANVLNIGLNYLFIYGKLGFPEMGASGAGLATLISRISMPVMILAYFSYNHSARRYFRLFDLTQQTWRHTKQLLKVGLPISAQMLMEILAFSITLIMMGWIGAVELAAHQVAVSVTSFTFMIFVGISSAATIMVSHSFGIKDFKALKRSATASYHLGFAGTVITMSIFILFRNYIPVLFTNDREVIAVAAQLFIFAGLFQIADGMQIVSLGILRGLQDVRITMVYSFMAYILIDIPVGYTCAFVLGMGAPGLWVGFIVGLGTAAILLYSRYRKIYRKLASSYGVIDTDVDI